MFYSKKLSEFNNLRHCFFSRKNGVSKGIYESLNSGLGSLDKKENVAKNLNLVSKKMGCRPESLITLNQTHSDRVVYFEKEDSIINKLPGDAIIISVKNVAIGVQTADCAPILFYEPRKKIIGCIHSGWKGALKGVVRNTIKKLVELDCDINEMVFSIGPCIGRKSYEVGLDLYAKFINENKKNHIFFEKKNDKYFFDLRKFVNNELLDLGVKKIDNLEMDTFSKSEFFFSHRRSIMNKEEDYGRCISVILMT